MTPLAPPTEAEVKALRTLFAPPSFNSMDSKVVALCDAYLAQQPIVGAARDPFLAIVEYHPDATEVGNAEMKRAADRFRAALSLSAKVKDGLTK